VSWCKSWKNHHPHRCTPDTCARAATGKFVQHWTNRRMMKFIHIVLLHYLLWWCVFGDYTFLPLLYGTWGGNLSLSWHWWTIMSSSMFCIRMNNIFVTYAGPALRMKFVNECLLVGRLNCFRPSTVPTCICSENANVCDLVRLVFNASTWKTIWGQ